MSNDIAIRVEHLTKEYRLGTISHGTLYKDLGSWWAKIRGQEDPNARLEDHVMEVGPASSSNLASSPSGRNARFLALDDISFELKHGEALGVIGRNGAGKSTLLKLLSRITAPTSGKVYINGRMSSLLEVGTGFHPELTGRENVFLNGAILGMSRAEIRKKFDEIVDFAEIGQFIDTPVKRYSSGMYVRLAFSVAAHLEPEIMVLDEVLAVGDAKFVKKSLQKMESVLRNGRTVIFVSHGLRSVVELCPTTILLREGKIAMKGATSEVVSFYGGEVMTNSPAERKWLDDEHAPGFEEVRFLGTRVCDLEGNTTAEIGINQSFEIEVKFRVLRKRWPVNAHAYVTNQAGEKILVSMDNLALKDPDAPREPGLYTERVRIPAPLLNEGRYYAETLICTNWTSERNYVVQDPLTFVVKDDKPADGVRGNWNREWPQYALRPRFVWKIIHEVDG